MEKASNAMKPDLLNLPSGLQSDWQHMHIMLQTVVEEVVSREMKLLHEQCERIEVLVQRQVDARAGQIWGLLDASEKLEEVAVLQEGVPSRTPMNSEKSKLPEPIIPMPHASESSKCQQTHSGPSDTVDTHAFSNPDQSQQPNPRQKEAKFHHRKAGAHVLQIWKEDTKEMFADSEPPRALQWAFDAASWWIDLAEPPRTGLLSKFVESKEFEAVLTCMILVNAGFLALVANYEFAHTNQGTTESMKYAELAFTCFFFVEVALKLMVHRGWFFINAHWQWNVFDMILVLLAVYDQVVVFYLANTQFANVSFMRVFRILKVAKILRMVRALRVFHSLRIMIQTLAGSLSALFWVFVMLGFLLYTFALVFVQGFTQLLSEQTDALDEKVVDEIRQKFGAVQAAMLILFMDTTGGPGWELSYGLVSLIGPLHAAFYIFYIAFFNFALFNILTALFVEHAMKQAEPENSTLIFETRRKELEDIDLMKSICHGIDFDDDGLISLEELLTHLRGKKARATMKLAGLDVHDAEVFFRLLSAATNSDRVDADTFVEVAMKMKGPAHAMDLQTLLYETKIMERHQNRLIESISAKVDQVSARLSRNEFTGSQQPPTPPRLATSQPELPALEASAVPLPGAVHND
eukprot:gnl/TRDRNA2_/TRDRNA2_163043_c1_seq1.p1 gnl/TRDRNA2_/TRDRNA2_163043_c1~~gnl/TRDRNA2_/TRDRNA2_163043_c1_seq1.p1  ORF type:complete len:635 (-),score=113.61 gnl/TRDRNA2_/TRDRNA2_163043_c1_seq1:508-2412(-)